MSSMVFMWRTIINAISDRTNTQILRRARKAMRVTAAVVKVSAPPTDPPPTHSLIHQPTHPLTHPRTHPNLFLFCLTLARNFASLYANHRTCSIDMFCFFLTSVLRCLYGNRRTMHCGAILVDLPESGPIAPSLLIGCLYGNRRSMRSTSIAV